MISNSGSDERGQYTGGQAGDQTGGEWQIRTWYNRPWNCVLRYEGANIRHKIAQLAEGAARNNNIGYNQANRDSFWRELQKVNYTPSKIKVKCDADCSSGIIAIVKAVGYIYNKSALKTVKATYTGNMRDAFRTAGFTILTDPKYLNSDDYLMRGDILLNDASHTATNLTNGKYAARELKPAYITTTDDIGFRQTVSTKTKTAKYVKYTDLPDKLKILSYKKVTNGILKAGSSIFYSDEVINDKGDKWIKTNGGWLPVIVTGKIMYK